MAIGLEENHSLDNIMLIIYTHVIKKRNSVHNHKQFISQVKYELEIN